MAERATIARPYAKAAFAYARENGRVADWARWLGIARQVVSSDEYARLAQGAGVRSSQLDELISSICGADCDPSGSAFLALLAENGRLDYLPEIALHFEQLVADDQNVADVEVISAVPLDERQKDRLATALRARLKREVRLSCSTDAGLIGGAVVRSGDLLIDGSLRSKLERLETDLTN